MYKEKIFAIGFIALMCIAIVVQICFLVAIVKERNTTKSLQGTGMLVARRQDKWHKSRILSHGLFIACLVLSTIFSVYTVYNIEEPNVVCVYPTDDAKMSSMANINVVCDYNMSGMMWQEVASAMGMSVVGNDGEEISISKIYRISVINYDSATLYLQEVDR